jgi:hypothetical protein
MGGGRFPWVKVPLWTRGEEGGLSAAVSRMASSVNFGCGGDCTVGRPTAD